MSTLAPIIFPGAAAGAQKHGAPPYVAKAVHFNGSAGLDSVGGITGVSASGLLSCSVWRKWSSLTSNQTLTIQDPNNNQYVDIYNSTSDLKIAIDSSNFASHISATFAGVITAGVWYNILFSADVNHSQGSKILAVYLNDSLLSPVVNIGDTGPAFQVTWTGLELTFENDLFGDNFIGDVADEWFAPGVSLLTGSTIAQADRRKFISATGKPVDLGADGSTPTGTAPAVFFTGDASTFGTNVGTGGPFTTIGTITNASTHP